MAQGDIRIGISGWTYGGWRGVFYPERLAQKRELAYAAGKFRTIEINGTFYGLQRPKAFGRWREETPEGFLFAVKGSRYITHMLRLRDIEIPLANFLASGVLRLGPKLGPFLWQFPPRMKFDPERFGAFLALLPKDTEEAAALAGRHDARLDGRSWLATEGHRRLRHGIEIRHESFCTPEFVELLRKHQVALVCADTVEWPLLMDVTADFVYVRLHGSEQLYTSGYDAAALDAWAKRVRAWSEGRDSPDGTRAGRPARVRKSGRDVFVFFDNDAKVRAPADAAELARRLA
ncbi:DUF72 domain-containing protein [Roseococcus sp. SYP-B2431]|uniref:DUF72 domain-containing protein n=1 Tax=Roseococcus sp. SYP-B2431 TaxID=2496640 RepID=UPI001039DE87|nr:DUF72 domain-containing protein [Roseococcus sp. SYP-B2431]TCH99878.1 DUF72 domain-containing protein [Roseococcus sp. SYP-B2431]